MVHYGEADAVVTLFTEAIGKVAAHGPRGSQERAGFAAALEPMHTMRVTLEERPGAELARRSAKPRWSSLARTSSAIWIA